MKVVFNIKGQALDIDPEQDIKTGWLYDKLGKLSGFVTDEWLYTLTGGIIGFIAEDRQPQKEQPQEEPQDEEKPQWAHVDRNKDRHSSKS